MCVGRGTQTYIHKHTHTHARTHTCGRHCGKVTDSHHSGNKFYLVSDISSTSTSVPPPFILTSVQCLARNPLACPLIHIDQCPVPCQKSLGLPLPIHIDQCPVPCQKCLGLPPPPFTLTSLVRHPLPPLSYSSVSCDFC